MISYEQLNDIIKRSSYGDGTPLASAHALVGTAKTARQLYEMHTAYTRSAQRMLRSLYDQIDSLQSFRVKNKAIRAKLVQAISDMGMVASLKPFVGTEADRKLAAEYHRGTINGLRAAIRVLSGGEV